MVRGLIKDKLNYKLRPTDIEACHCLGNRTLNENRSIVTHFRFRDTKIELMKNWKNWGYRTHFRWRPQSWNARTSQRTKRPPKSRKLLGLGCSLPEIVAIRPVVFNVAEIGKKFLITYSNVTWPYMYFLSCQSVVLLLLILWCINTWLLHYDDVIMSMMPSHITSLTVVYSTVYSGTDQRKHQSSTSLAFVRGIDLCPVNSRTKGQ